MSQSLKFSLALAFGLAIASRLPADESSLGPRHGVLLLRNGELVAGEVLLSGDRYDVSVAGGQIHIKRSEVEYFGATVLDCYERRRSHVEPGKVQENLELAEWCMRQQLYEQAAPGAGRRGRRRSNASADRAAGAAAQVRARAAHGSGRQVGAGG